MPPSAKTHFEWLAHRRSPCDRYLSRMMRLEPTVRLLYELPMWRLLSNELVSESDVSRLMSLFHTKGSAYEELIPRKQYQYESYIRWPSILSRGNGGGIRTDLYAFMETLAEARILEYEGDWYEYDLRLQELFTVFPIVGKTKWLVEESERFFFALFELYLRTPYDSRRFQPDPRIVFGQLAQPNFCLSESWWTESEKPHLHFVANPAVDRSIEVELHSLEDLIRYFGINGSRDLVGNPWLETSVSGSKKTFVEAFFTLVDYCRIPRHCWEPITRIHARKFAIWAVGDTLGSHCIDQVVGSLFDLAVIQEKAGLSLQERADWMMTPRSDDSVRPVDLLATAQLEQVVQYASQCFE